MDSRHLIDPELLPFLEQYPKLDLTNEILPGVRNAFDAFPRGGGIPEPDDVIVDDVQFPGRDGAPPVHGLVYRSKTASPSNLVGGIVHMHGGGFVIGRAIQNDAILRVLASTLGCVILTVDYRLAPETAFPGPIEDCYAGLVWFAENAERLHVDTTRIAIKGESAGGGLAAALALLARDRQDVAICYQHLVYPMLDDRTASTAPDPNPYAGEFLWTAQMNRFGWTSMLGHEPGVGEVSPYCAAARAKDLHGLPPAFVQVGALDLFVDEDMEYARRLMRAGVPTELHVYPGGYHAFDGAVGSKLAAQFHRDGMAALSKALAPKK